MKRLGIVLHVLDSNLIVRWEKDKKDIPKPNIIVLTKKMEKIGRIREIFGPVDCPYFLVRVFKNITTSELEALKKERVYTLE